MIAPAPPQSILDPGRLAFVAKMFPRISETFIVRELHALGREGVPVCVYSLLPPVRDARVHPEADALLEQTYVLPQPSWAERRSFVRSLARCARLAPIRTALEVVRALLPPSRRSIRHLFQAVLLADRLRRDEIAHIHAAWAHAPASTVTIASRLTGIPWSIAAHAKDIYTSNQRSLARKLEAATFALACSATHATHLRQLLSRHGRGQGAGSVVLAYHGVDTDFFTPLAPAEPQATPLILTVGRLVPKKGLETLIESAALLRARRVAFRLEIVGEGPLRGELERRIRDLALEDAVGLRGLLVREEVREAMRSASCFALPCRIAPGGDRDGLPNALAEAMACGVAVVSTKLPSIQELVVDGVSGILVPPDDPAALADAIGRVLLDPNEGRRLGWGGRSRVLERFASSRCEAERTRHLAQSIGVRRLLYISADRGVPVRGTKGASIHVRSLARAWGDAGLELRLVSTSSGPADGAKPAAVLVPAHSAPWVAAAARAFARFVTLGRRTGDRTAVERALLRLVDNIAVYRAGLAATRKWRPDAVVERYSLNALAGGLLARRLGIPHVLEVNAPLADEEARHRGLRWATLTRFLEGWILRRADLVLVVSPALIEHALRLGVRTDRLQVIPNGVDPSLFHTGCDGKEVRARLGFEDTFVIGFAGTLKPWHGVDHLIRGFTRALREEPEIQLLIMGDGPERIRLEELARDLGVAERVRFLGIVPHEEMGGYLAACDVLAAPYGPAKDFYFSPLKVAEYRAVGRPVVASRIGVLGQTLDASNGVVLVEPGDEADLARALVELIQDSERREALARAAASSVWTWSHVARATTDAIQAARGRLWGWPRMRPLTVGYVLKMFPRFSETFILNEILELERTGVRVVIFSMKQPNEPFRQPGAVRVRAPVLVLPPLTSASLGPLVRSHISSFLKHPIRYRAAAVYAWSRRSESARDKFLTAAYVAREARRFGVEHLHAHFASGPARQAKLASMLSGIPFSFTAHAKDLYWSGHHYGERHKLKKRLRLASFVVAISDRNKHFFETLGFHVPRRRVVRIYNGLDVEAWPFLRPDGRPRGEPDTRPVVLAVGRLVEKKGFAVLLEAVARLRGRGLALRCWVAGEGPERGRLLQAVRGLNLEDSVEFLGPVPQDRLIAELYPRANVLAQPSVVAADGDQDGIPTVLLEAMAVGLPVVATSVSGITEVVRDGSTGLVVPPQDADALADALYRVLDDPCLAARLAAGGRQMIEERFNVKENAQHLVHLFRSSAHGTPYWRDASLPAHLGIGTAERVARLLALFLGVELGFPEP